MSHLNGFFYPLVIYPIYLFVGEFILKNVTAWARMWNFEHFFIFSGPWAVVYLLGNRLGIVFAWGIIIDGEYEPSWITYPFGWKQVSLVI